MSRFTPNYQLHQWDPEDNFLRTDFNEDLSKIDTALASKADNSAITNLQGQINNLPNSDAVANLQNQINAQQQQINSKPNSSAITNLQNQINTQKNQISTQQSQINTLSSGKAEFVQGFYSGNGSESVPQSINLGFQPRAVFITGDQYSTMAISNYARLVTITSTGFNVLHHSVYTPTPNANRTGYCYLALR